MYPLPLLGILSTRRKHIWSINLSSQLAWKYNLFRLKWKKRPIIGKINFNFQDYESSLHIFLSNPHTNIFITLHLLTWIYIVIERGVLCTSISKIVPKILWLETIRHLETLLKVTFVAQIVPRMLPSHHFDWAPA